MIPMANGWRVPKVALQLIVMMSRAEPRNSYKQTMPLFSCPRGAVSLLESRGLESDIYFSEDKFNKL